MENLFATDATLGHPPTDNFSEGEVNCGGRYMLGLLGFLIAPILVGALVAAALSAGTQYGYYKLVTQPQQEKMKAKNEEMANKQEAKAKLASIQAYKMEIANIGRGTVYANKELLDNKRERQAALRNHGMPVRTA